MNAPEFDTAQLFAMAAALGWASGMRLYAAVFLTGLAGYLGWVPLPAGLSVLQQPAILYVSGCLLAVEFIADKVPWVDSLWDSVHTFIRIPAGAALAYSVFGADPGSWGVIAALLGGTLAATSHAAKTSTRAAVNTSPEPFSNIGLSLAGDAMVPAMLWLAHEYPSAFFVVLAFVIFISIVVIVLLLRFLRGLVRRLRAHFAAPEMERPSSLALATPRGGRPPTDRPSRIRGGKLGSAEDQ
jgi:Domain of unknown function (DUF4126)